MGELVEGLTSETHILLKLCKCFPDAVLNEDDGLAVGPPLRCRVQTLADSQVEQRDGGGAVDVAVGQSGDVRGIVHVERPGIEIKIKGKAQGSNTGEGHYETQTLSY